MKTRFTMNYHVGKVRDGDKHVYVAQPSKNAVNVYRTNAVQTQWSNQLNLGSERYPGEFRRGSL
jgi:hypothetical protein